MPQQYKIRLDSSHLLAFSIKCSTEILGSVDTAVLLRLFGGFVATVIYLAVALAILNRRRHLQNGILAVAVPSGVYLLFDSLLNANMPPALFDMPF